MEAFIEELRSHYETVSVRNGPGGASLIRVDGVVLPGQRKTTSVLVVLNPQFRSSGGRPPVFVAPGTTLANGSQGRNVTPVMVEGETWLQFSFNFPWSVADAAWKLVEGAVRRFAKPE